ncbi:hypothetical protein JXK06_00085, partial [Patescibacteria group bacterium]|nr:hypothetical protein [Patescibacteria group bacterium]
ILILIVKKLTMCKAGISCAYGTERGRIKNIRLNESKNNIVGDFEGNDSRDIKLVAIVSIIPLHKKAAKQLKESLEPLRKQFVSAPEEKFAV